MISVQSSDHSLAYNMDGPPDLYPNLMQVDYLELKLIVKHEAPGKRLEILVTKAVQSCIFQGIYVKLYLEDVTLLTLSIARPVRLKYG